MNILLLNPETPDKYWSFKHITMMFSRRRSANPPLGLLTISAMLPENWNRKLVDLNVDKLRDRDIKWAEYIYINATAEQADSADILIDKCHQAGRRVIAGGPHFTANFENYNHVDHLVLNEAELTLPDFIEGYDANWPWKLYRSNKLADMSLAPIPDYSIAPIKKYSQLSVQYSRGCPSNCSPCETTEIHGNELRTKSTSQILLELDNIYDTGFRGNIFFDDDNFLCNSETLKADLLPSIIKWNRIHRNPFTFNSEVSIDISNDKELLDLMIEAGFTKVFVEMNASDEELLFDCDKRFVIHRNLLLSIKNIQRRGLEVMGVQ